MSDSTRLQIRKRLPCLTSQEKVVHTGTGPLSRGLVVTILTTFIVWRTKVAELAGCAQNPIWVEKGLLIFIRPLNPINRFLWYCEDVIFSCKRTGIPINSCFQRQLLFNLFSYHNKMNRYLVNIFLMKRLFYPRYPFMCKVFLNLDSHIVISLTDNFRFRYWNRMPFCLN